MDAKEIITAIAILSIPLTLSALVRFVIDRLFPDPPHKGTSYNPSAFGKEKGKERRP